MEHGTLQESLGPYWPEVYKLFNFAPQEQGEVEGLRRDLTNSANELKTKRTNLRPHTISPTRTSQQCGHEPTSFDNQQSTESGKEPPANRSRPERDIVELLSLASPESECQNDQQSED